VMIKVDVDKTPAEVAVHYGIGGYPTFIKVNAQMKEYAYVGGLWNQNDFESVLAVMDSFVNHGTYDFQD
jgi:hypothetical protein